MQAWCISSQFQACTLVLFIRYSFGCFQFCPSQKNQKLCGCYSSLQACGFFHLLLALHLLYCARLLCFHSSYLELRLTKKALFIIQLLHLPFCCYVLILLFCGTLAFNYHTWLLSVLWWLKNQYQRGFILKTNGFKKGGK